MRDRWYGDKRDLVKWGVLLNLATDHGAGKILQITYFRPGEWPPLEIDGKERSIPETGAATLPGCTQRQQQRSPAILQACSF